MSSYSYLALLLPSGETEDTGTIGLLFTVSGVDEFTGATEYLDADTVRLSFTPSGVDVAADVESATVPVLLTPSFAEIFAGATVDAGTILVTFTPTGVDVLAHETSDSGTADLRFTPSGTDYIHVCKPRFRATLLSWEYDPEAMKEDWFGGLLLPNWHAELLLTEMAVNYDC